MEIIVAGILAGTVIISIFMITLSQYKRFVSKGDKARVYDHMHSITSMYLEEQREAINQINEQSKEVKEDLHKEYSDLCEKVRYLSDQIDSIKISRR